MDPVALIDADSLYFRVCYKTKKKNEIRKNIDASLLEISGQTLMAPQQIAVKGRGNFRKDLYPDYKKNRKELPEELKQALNYAHEYIVGEHGAVMADGMEADDLVAIWAYEAREKEIPYFVCGIDKDLLQIPGHHYNFVKHEHQFIDDDLAYHKLMVQCITGDSTDNIPGIKGIGPKKAEKIFEANPNTDKWKLVCDTWQAHNAGHPKLSYQLLRMLTDWEDYEKIKKQIANKTPKRQQHVGSEGKEDV